MLNYRNAFWTLVAILAVFYGYRYANTPQDASVSNSKKVAFITGGPDEFWQLTAAGAKKAATEFGMELELLMPEESEDLSSQMKLLTQLEPHKLAGLAISPIAAEDQTLFINRLSEETTVITFDSDAPLSIRNGYVGTSNYGAGQKCAKLVHESLPEGGKVAVLMANETKANLLDRRKGFLEDLHRVLPGEVRDLPSDYQVVSYLVDNGDNAKCAEMIEETLNAHPDLGCFVGLNAQHGPILLEVLKNLNKLGEVNLITFDEEDATLDGIEAGHVFATVAQDPFMFGYEAVRIISSRQKLGLGTGASMLRRGDWTVASRVVKQENLAEFREEVQSKKQEAAKLRQSKS